MDLSAVKRGLVIILILLCAVLVANTSSNILMTAFRLSGIPGFIANFILYAVIFFGVLYFFERFFGLNVFYFGRK